MRGHWWGLVVLVAATSLAVSAKPTASSTSDSVTIPLILRQPGDAKPPEPKKKTPPPAKTEPKSPQEILEQSTPVAMQATDRSPEVPLLSTPPAPTLDPALPTAPELFIPDLTAPLPVPKAPLSEPKPQPKIKAPALASELKPQPKNLLPAPATSPEAKAPPVRLPAPKPPAPDPLQKPAIPPHFEMQPIDDVKPSQLRQGIAERKSQSKKLSPVPESQPEPATSQQVEMRPVEEFKPGKLREDSDGKPPSFRCRVRDVMAFHDRTHVRCYNKVQGKVYYFAVDTNQPVASTVVAKALTAMQTGKPLGIVFAPGTDLNPPNCGPNCRRLLDIAN